MSKRKQGMSLDQANLDSYFKNRRPPGPLKAAVGDRVAYTRYFLRQTGHPATDPAWRQRGEVLELHSNSVWVLVRWDGDEEPMWVALDHLAHEPGKHGLSARFAD